MSGHEPEAGLLGVTAGIHPKGDTEVGVVNSLSELIAHLQHQTRLSQCLINEGGTWPKGDVIPVGLADGALSHGRKGGFNRNPTDTMPKGHIPSPVVLRVPLVTPYPVALASSQGICVTFCVVCFVVFWGRVSIALPDS